MLAGVVLGAIVLGAQACSPVDLGRSQPDASHEPQDSPPILAPVVVDGGDAATTQVPPSLLCVASECPYPRASCGVGQADGDLCPVDLLTDRNNCGECGNVCPTFPPLTLTSTCVGGVCEPECVSAETNQNCNGLIEDGCETNVKEDPNNCGACGNVCPDGVNCHDGICGCPPGQVECSGRCRDLMTDDTNCGACGVRCRLLGSRPPNTTYGCVAGKCDFKCLTFGSDIWADCNNDLEKDGCEINLGNDAENCGQCGAECAPGKLCRSLARNPPACICNDTDSMCGNLATDDIWCADLLNDPLNCGACGHQCPEPSGATGGQGRAVCRKGLCGYECQPGWGDCDEDRANGCETNLLSDARHCGACGSACESDAGQPCIDGVCLMKDCAPGETK